MKKAISFLWVFLGLLYAAAGGSAAALEVRSPVFRNGDLIPAKYTCKEEDISPPLEWSQVPPDTESLAIILDDPDASTGIWVHWVIYGIPPEKNSFPEGAKKEKELRDGSVQGVNSFGRIGYDGPCPPAGALHRYFFTLYALDKKLGLEPGLTREELLEAMKGHIKAQAWLMGKFRR